jgi:hypothetical protein
MDRRPRVLSGAVLSLALCACGGADDNAAAADAGLTADAAVAPPEPPTGVTAACPGGLERGNPSSLTFDGVDDHVAMGPAPALGLDRFTLEGWVKRDGTGASFGTGVGGLSLVPIMGKGRGESDGSNVDCNYAFGFAGEVLGADFEDAATGANHPVLGRTRIPFGEWHHVAATYDGARWQLFVDGRLDGEENAGATPRKDSIQHFALGSALDSKGTPVGFLKGSLDEVRVWDRARSEAEIAADAWKRVTRAPGLIARWTLDAQDGPADTVGQNPGTLVGAPAFAAAGAALDVGLPPAIALEAPSARGEVTGSAAELAVKVSDVDSEKLTATFHVREVTDTDDFTIAVLPDTQYYTRVGDDPKYFHDQTQWVMDNAEAYNIVGVIHNGDIVDNGNIDSQWAVATAAMARLEVGSARLPEGMPYGTGAGNHDQSPNGVVGSTTKYNLHFGPQRFAKRTYFGGTYESDKADENWVTFNGAGLEIVVVNLQFGAVAREAPVLDWTRKIFRQHPGAFGIVNSHYIVNGQGNFGPAGQSIYDAVKDVSNVQLLTCGHISNEQKRTDVFEGHTVHSMLADYQSRANGGGGVMRIWEFSPKNDELTVRSYSPTEKKFETDADSEFTLKVDLSGAAGGAFREAAKVDPAAPGVVRASVDGLTPGRTYEWYVDVTDCAHSVTSARYRFRTR